MQLPVSVRATAPRFLSNAVGDEESTKGLRDGDKFPWRQAPVPSRQGFMQRVVQYVIHRRLLRVIADENFVVSSGVRTSVRDIFVHV